MDVIITHTHADFDAIASMIAAKKLYPLAKLVLPGSCEENVRIFLEKHKLSYEFFKIKNIELEKITRLIIVDTRVQTRIGKFEEILDNPHLKLHIFDHHSSHFGDLIGEKNYVEELGATVTIITEIIKKKGILLTSEEATLFAFGIYEDTGFLTYKTTTLRDIAMCSYLLTQKARLEIIPDFIQEKLSVDQIVLINKLIQSQKEYFVNGVKIIISSVKADEYKRDLSSLTHELRDIEKIDCLFTLFEKNDRISIIARSRIDLVNVDIILQEFHGGGHPTAASAVVKNLSLEETEKKLLQILKKHLKNKKIILEKKEEIVEHKNLKKIIQGRSYKHIYGLLQEIGKVADEFNYFVFAVGGFVRDVLLSIPNTDIDIVVEGDGIEFAKKFVQKKGGHLKIHTRFHTAIIFLPNKIKIDVTSARKESYKHPGALPSVEKSLIKHDLHRRDFTINGLAISLNKNSFGDLYDFFQGQRDLKNGIIKVLHNFSFIDDPTRIMRAIRFEQRYKFKIESHSAILLENAVKSKMLEKITIERFREELFYMLKELDPLKPIEKLNYFGILKFIHPKIHLDNYLREIFVRAKQILNWFDLLFLKKVVEKYLFYFLILIDKLNEEEAIFLTKRLKLSKYACVVISITKKLTDEIIQKLSIQKIKKSEIYKNLTNLPNETLLYMMTKSKKVRVKKRISFYFTHLVEMKLEINGKSLISYGFKESPLLGKILNEILLAKIDGKIEKKEEELNMAKKLSKQFF
ncbi:MAG: DHHA1 domain-containing protein [bacterium]